MCSSDLSITESASPNRLYDEQVNFIALNVGVGDIVYNNTSNLGATVLEVESQYGLVLNADIASSAGDSYTIYQASAQTGLGNQGCCLLAMDNDNVSIVTIGGDNVTIYIQKGNILPLQVKKITYGNVIALW